ncbi:TonB-dependent receptor [Geomonas silvestris]|uniref:TonB-dependent receptor n=1 Tax=Geomonas silvestris TaxID=2740184 RepID=A0A6V8MHM3_9BACT|nr:TonB family protein [Geomonas silvestris]GFO59434.1 TonB-dependent receptor [Geomonas silvestris]
MTEALQETEAIAHLTVNRKLVLGLVASLFLHLGAAAVLISLSGSQPAHVPAVTYVDLKSVPSPAPPSAPPKQETATPPVTPEPPVQPAPAEPVKRQPVETPPAQPATPPQAKPDEDRSHTVLGLGLTRGYFKSLGEGDTLRDDIKAYYLDMLQVINEKWWMNEEIDKRRVAPVVVLLAVARNGSILEARISESSGNRQYDKAVLDSIAKAGPLPPLPASYDMQVFLAPIRLVPPLNLMGW